MQVKKLSVLLFCLLVPTIVLAEETVYVGDYLVITVRSGQGSQYQIIKTLPTGTKMTLLEETDTGYTRIRTEDGTEGWVRTQYVSKQPINKVKLEYTRKKLAKVNAQNTELKKELAELRKTSSTLNKDQQSLSSDNKALQEELARLKKVAARPIELDEENSKLRQSNVSLEKELQLVNQENQVLKDRSQREWFIAGALVLLGGMIFGLIIPKIRWKKSSSW